MNLTDILQALPSLSKTEQQRIMEAIRAGDQLDPLNPPIASLHPAARASDSDLEVLLDALCTFLRDRGLGFASAPLLKRTHAYRAFRSNASFIGPWLKRSGMTRNEKRLLFSCVLPLLHQYLAQGNDTVGAGQMLKNMHKLPAIVDAQLPGYAHAGLLRLVIKKGNAG